MPTGLSRLPLPAPGRATGLLCALLSAIAILAALGAPNARAAATSALPDTTDGVHVGLPFLRCYKETWFVGSANSPGCNEAAASSIGDLRSQPVDIGWMWTYGYFTPAQTGAPARLGGAFSYDRMPAWEVNPADGSAHPNLLSDLRAAHPDWISYTCATTDGHHDVPAWEYGDVPANANSPAYVPFDVTNPAVREYMWEHYYRPSLQAGYTMLFFDNVNLSNFANRCGHYDSDGNWVQQYAGDGSDASKFKQDVFDWLAFLRDRIHGYDPNALLAVNYNPTEGGDSPSAYRQVYDLVDVVWNEGGFTGWGASWPTLGKGWGEHVAALQELAQRPDKALIVNGIIQPAGSANDAHRISASQRSWVIANYLLVKGARTYSAVTTADYGYYTDFPEYHLPIGRPTENMQRDGALALRHFTGGIAIVNPDGKSAHDIALPAGAYQALGGAAVTHVSLDPKSAAILLNQDAGQATQGTDPPATGPGTTPTGTLGPVSPGPARSPRIKLSVTTRCRKQGARVTCSTGGRVRVPSTRSSRACRGRVLVTLKVGNTRVFAKGRVSRTCRYKAGTRFFARRGVGHAGVSVSYRGKLGGGSVGPIRVRIH